MGRDECVVVLAGGQGARLKPYTSVLPKPLIPVGDVPILEVVVQQLRDAGFSRLILAVNQHEHLLRSYFGDGARFGVGIEYSREDIALGTIGPLHPVEDRLTEHFLVMNGDLLTNFPYGSCLEDHAASGGLLTVGTCKRTVCVNDGVIETDASGTIVGFREKPAIDFWISNGIYAMSRDVLSHIPPRRRFGMDELVLSLLDKGVPVRTFPHHGEWYDIGSAEDLERATAAFGERREEFLPAERRLVGAG